jgi:hypothetical protein
MARDGWSDLFAEDGRSQNSDSDAGKAAPVRASKEAVVKAAKQVIAKAQSTRLPPPAMHVEPCESDCASFQIEQDLNDMVMEALGAAPSVDSSRKTPAPFVSSSSVVFPVFSRLYGKFAAAMPSPKLVRVDDEESYADFRDFRRSPYLEALATQIDDLETALQASTDTDASSLGDALQKASTGGIKVPLSLHPMSKGKIECWQDGPEIVCSVRFLAPDRSIRIVTTGTPIEKHIEEVSSYADEADVDPYEIIGVLPVIAQVLGGGSLVPQIVAASPVLFSRRDVIGNKTFVGKLECSGDPSLAAAMEFCQLCQKGDRQALVEARAIRQTPGGAALLGVAERRLSSAQRSKGTLVGARTR